MSSHLESPPRPASGARPGGPDRVRLQALDSARGFAVLCMVVDHLCVIFDGPAELRYTVGRLALPLFFITAGYLVPARLNTRHIRIAAAGVLLPVAAPWIDSPNVLVWYALGSALLVWIGCDYHPSRFRGGLVICVALGLAANGWLQPLEGSYNPIALWALMCLGMLLPSSWWDWALRIPGQLLLTFVGRHALELYVVHVLALTAIAGLRN